MRTRYKGGLKGSMGVNPTTTVDATKDMGEDNGAQKEVFGYQIGYNSEDYQAISGRTVVPTLHAGSTTTTIQGLYNGNIRYTMNQIQGLGAIAYHYTYDPLNRLSGMTSQTITGNAWTFSPTGNAYREAVNYDANGNIQNYARRDATGGFLDDLTYSYNGTSKNRLTAVADATPNTPNFADDVEGTETFDYDANGNLIGQFKGTSQQILTWNAYGKVQSVTQHRRNLSTGSMVLHSTMVFGYDAHQHRLKKSVTVNGVTKTTYYIRDAQGNPLAVYERTNGTTLTWKEQDLYGSSRLGMQKPEKVVTGYLYYDCPNGWYGSWTKSGAKSYELSNHLGNVMAVISDRGVVQNTQDYYPFGMAMPGRSSEIPYKYGFNGQEKDLEMGGGVYTAEFWQYDARLGRRMNVDPVTFPWQSTYATFNNNPIALSDPTGAVAGDPPGGGEPATVDAPYERNMRKG